MILLAQSDASLPVLRIAVELAGGLALFLYGLTLMTDALKALAGRKLRLLLNRFTDRPIKAVLTGAFVTAVTQSSSITTVLLVGFISAGLMTLSQSVGVIMGANIGSTVTAQIIAFKITTAALPMVTVGFFVQFLARTSTLRRSGQMLLGFGLLFLGLILMSDATSPLRSYEPFIKLMGRMDNPWLGILVGAVFTAVVQSSAATTGILIVLAGQGVLTLEAGIAIALGANIGTCSTAMLATIGATREARQAAVVHVLFNIVGVLIWLPMLAWLEAATRWISPETTGVSEAAKLMADTPRQIANAHTLFNVANTLLLIWFISPLTWLVRKLVPVRASREADLGQPRYLEPIYVGTPSLALDRVVLELGHVGERVQVMFGHALEAAMVGRETQLDRVVKLDDAIDHLHAAIIEYVTKLNRAAMVESDDERAGRLLAINGYYENLADVIETQLVDIGRSRLEEGTRFSDETKQRMRELGELVRKAVELSRESVVEHDTGKARSVVAMKPAVDEQCDAIRQHLRQRLRAEAPDRVTTFRLETDLIEHLSRIYYFAKRIAKVIADVRRDHEVTDDPPEAETAAPV